MASHSRPLTHRFAPMSQAKIAIIEDDPDNRYLLEAMLEDDYQLDPYVDGVAGLEGMRADPPALVLLDLSLPRLTGPEVLAQIRSDPRLADIPVVALTAHAHARERCLAQGFDAFVSKPILDESALFDTIRDLLEPSLES